MRWRPLGCVPVVVAALLATGCSGGAGAIAARYECFRFHIEKAQPRSDSVLAADVVATNVTASSCTGPPCGGVTGRFVITNADGREVEHEGGGGVMCQSHVPPPVPVRPGASVVWDSIQWDGQGDLTGPRCVPGDCRLTRPKLKAGRYRISWPWLDAVDIRSAWIHTVGEG